MTRMTTWTRFSQYLLVVRLHEPTSDVGKCGSLRHSTMSFSENFVVAKTSYQMLEILSFSEQERALRPSTDPPPR